MSRFFSPFSRIIGLLFALVVSCISSLAQSPQERRFIEESGSGMMFWIIVLVLVAIAGGGFVFWRRTQAKVIAGSQESDKYSNSYGNGDSYDMDGLDVDKELEWLRKAKRSSRTNSAKTRAPAVVSETPSKRSVSAGDIDTKAFQEKMRKLQYAQLPINSFVKVTASKIFEPLPYSEDPSLLNAIEQANEEFEEDESVRELAVKILTAFRARNAVDALSQIALYDLSSNLRSKAVSILTDFDHPSVFEPILLACADPTREVRAAAARGLFRLSFDRADAWKRLIENNDEFRMIHAAKAAIESGIAIKSFDRLVHEDLKVANEAFSLTSFIVRSGETDEIFTALKEHKDERIKFALLHVIKVLGDERAIEKLKELKRTANFTEDVSQRVDDTIKSAYQVVA